MSSGTALSCDGQKTISTSISIKALFSWCYPVACWTFKRFCFLWYIWFGFSSFARRIRSVAISNGSFFYSFLVRKKKYLFSRAKKALNGNFYESLMQDEIQLLFLSFFPFYFFYFYGNEEGVRASNSELLLQWWLGEEKKGDTNTKFNGTPGQFLLLVSVNGFFNKLKFRVFAMQLFQLEWTWKFK